MFRTIFPSLRTCTALQPTFGIALALSCGAVNAGDFYIRLNDAVSTQERAVLQQSIKAQIVKSVPSLGHGVEVWRSFDPPDALQQKLGSDQRVALHDRITGDYRDLFDELDPGMDVAPVVAKNLAVIRQRATTQAVRAVQMKSSTLTSRMLINGFDQTDGFASPGTVRINLFPSTNVIAVKQRLEIHGPQDLNWSGIVTRTADLPLSTLKDGPAATGSSNIASQGDAAPGSLPHKGIATLSIKNGEIIGRVSVGPDTYTITPIGKGFHAIVKIDPKKFPSEHPPSQKSVEGKLPEIKFGEVDLPQSGQSLKNSDGTLNDIPPMPTISVGIAYTKGASALLGAMTPDQFSEALVNITNTSYANSQVRTKLVLAGSTVVDFVESDWDEDIKLLKQPTGGPFGDVHLWRKGIGANMIVLIVTLDSYCGLAGNILAGKDDAFAMVSQTCALDNLSFPHEVGHLQGARHDENTDPTDTPFAYGHGYRFVPYWRTIMAYDGDCGCSRLPYWANPNVMMNGVPMGTVARNHDARVLSETAARVAGFKP